MQETETTERVIVREANPFAPLVKLKNLNFVSTGSPYESLLDRIESAKEDSEILNSIEKLRSRLNGLTYKQHHFGELKLIPAHLIDINIDIQRFIENKHIASDIIELFDPRILQPINVVYIKSTGKYSAWDGQQSAATVALLQHFGLIDPDVLIQVKVFDDDLEVTGSNLKGEAVGNFGFRCLNGKGRKPVDAYFTHRSRVNGVRLYGSDLEEDRQSDEIQKIIESNNMFPAPPDDGKYDRALPGMITHISAINDIASHGSNREAFEIGKEDLDWALHWHNRYFSHVKGVDGGFIMAFGRLHSESRGRPQTKDSAAIPPVQITRELEDGLYNMIKDLYLIPKGFHANCKTRLTEWQKKNNMRSSWSDSCLTPFLVLDYVTWGKCSAPIPNVSGISLYCGI
jgi:hypothetical protein